MEHHKYSPSKLEMFKKCPGSFEASRHYPNKTNPASLEGEKLHEIMANPEKAYQATLEQDKLLDMCREKIIDQLEELGFDGNCNEKREIKVNIIDYEGNVLTEGTADYLAVSGNEALLIDWKFGWVKVNGKKNIQLMTYATGIFDKFPYINNIKACIYQPRLNNFTSDWYSREEHYDLMIDLIKKVIDRTKTDKFNFKTGDHCKYCKANGKVHCPASCHEITAVKTVDNELVSDLSDEDITMLYEQSKRVKSNIDKIKKEFEKRVFEKGEMCGYKTQKSYGNKVIKDASEAFEILVREDKELTGEEFAECSKTSPAQLIKIISDKRYKRLKESGEKTTRKACNDYADKLISNFYTKPESVKIVKIDVD